MTERIINVWFDPDRIYIRTDADEIYSRALSLFPNLKDASSAQREEFSIELGGEAIRWPSIDEDIHVSSFIEELPPIQSNPVADMMARFPWLNVSAVAKNMGINQSLFAQYMYGVKRPSNERLEQIRKALHSMGQAMMSI